MGSLQNPGEIHFDCVSHAGRFEKWEHEVSPASGMITGSLYFRSIWVPNKWIPVATVLIAGKPDAHTERAGLGFGREHADTMRPELVYEDPRRGFTRTWYKQLAANLGADMRFELRWVGTRAEVRFPPNEEWSPVPMAFTPERVTLACSSSEVIYHDVTVTSPLTQ
jgi:hypothetical protein